MDPWLEGRWSGVHAALIAIAQEELNKCLPPDLAARINERVFVGYADKPRRPIEPDVFVVRSRPVGTLVATGDTAVLDEPIIIRCGEEPLTETYIEIIHAGDESTVITAIEVVSLANKGTTQSRREYEQKRDEYHAAGVSTIEIDLLRAGPHVVGVPLGYLTGHLLTPYKVCVHRGWKIGAYEAEYYPIPLNARLPRIRVPLRQTDADVGLDLQLLLNTAYARGRYEQTNYSRLLDPPLSPDDAAWAAEQIAVWRGAGG